MFDRHADLKGDLRLEQTRIETGPRAGETILCPVWEDGSYNVYAMQMLAHQMIGGRNAPLETRRKLFNAIAHVHVAAELFEIDDFEYRLSYDLGLTRDELLCIDFACKIPLRDLRAVLRKKRQGIEALDLHKQIAAHKPLSPSAANSLKSNIIKYFEFLMRSGDAALTRHIVPDGDILTRRAAFQDIRECIIPPKPPSGGGRAPFTAYHLAKLEEFMETYDPHEIWSDPFIALRNQVMFDLQFWGGLRKGEVLLLKMKDVKPRTANGIIEIHVRNRRYDPKDPRQIPPAAKTGSGVVTVREDVFERIETYKRAVRELWDDAEDRGLTRNLGHGFLIISGSPRKPATYGAPLSTSGFNYAWTTLRRAARITDPTREEYDRHPVSDHALRHLCAMRYVRRRQEKGDSEEAIQVGLRDFFRWSAKSEMPFHYTSRQAAADLYADHDDAASLLEDERFLRDMGQDDI